MRSIDSLLYFQWRHILSNLSEFVISFFPFSIMEVPILRSLSSNRSSDVMFVVVPLTTLVPFNVILLPVLSKIITLSHHKTDIWDLFPVSIEELSEFDTVPFHGGKDDDFVHQYHQAIKILGFLTIFVVICRSKIVLPSQNDSILIRTYVGYSSTDNLISKIIRTVPGT